MVDQHYFARSQQALRDHQGADLVVGDNPASVADDVGIALRESQHDIGAQASVHAGDDGYLLCRRRWQIALLEGLSVSLIVPKQLVRGAHSATARFLS